MKNQNLPVAFLLFFTVVGWMIAIHFLFYNEPAIKFVATPAVGEREVTDLITRLKPLTEYPNGEWYRSGIEIVFYATGVRIKLKLKNRNEYNADAKTLTEAVNMLTAPNDDIRAALLNWKGNSQ